MDKKISRGKMDIREILYAAKDACSIREITEKTGWSRYRIMSSLEITGNRDLVMEKLEDNRNKRYYLQK